MKRKNFPKIDTFDYWMGLAFVMGAKSPSKNAALIVENSLLVSYGIDTPPPVTDNPNAVISAEAIAIINCKKDLSNAVLYLTRTPDYNVAIMIMAKIGLRKIIYFPTEPLDSKVKDLFLGFFGEIDEYKVNLNWIYDYLGSLDL